MTARDAAKGAKGNNVLDRREARHAPSLAAMGLEAEFSVVIDGQQVKPEDVFGSPTNIVRVPMMHRVGRSYHLPTGGAVYFDTGVIEIATPLIEIDRGCAARAGRSLWEGIRFLRQELDAWEEREGRTVQLAGFSTHYNVSFDRTGDAHAESAAHPEGAPADPGTVEELALLLTHILPFPVMLLAANRKSTGIGVRPRVNRIEVTADFTPDAALMIAAATLVVGVAREVMQWSSFSTDLLAAHGVPVVRGFAPEPHSSRQGWVARFSSFDENPFAADVDAPLWDVGGDKKLSLRRIARRIARRFWPSIRRTGDPRSLRLIRNVLLGRAPSLLELDDRPAGYDSVGRLCTWANLFPVRALPRSRYEQVFIRAISRRPLTLDGDKFTPIGMRGWSRVVFRRERDRTRHVFSLDFLLRHLDTWTLGPRAERRLTRTLRTRLDQR